MVGRKSEDAPLENATYFRKEVQSVPHDDGILNANEVLRPACLVTSACRRDICMAGQISMLATIG